MKLSIVIPAYNEEKRIIPTLERVLSFIKERAYNAEVIVVDDGSKDATASVVSIYPVRLIRYSPNRGKGYAVNTGMKAATGELILFSDADLSTPIEELDSFLPFTKECGVIIGSRSNRAKLSKRQPIHRELLGKAFNAIVSLLTVRGFRDTQCGFKLFTKRAANIIVPRQRIFGFGFDVEQLFIAQKHGLRIKEMPVRWMNNEDSRVRLTHAFAMFTEIVRMRMNAWKGLYK